MARKDWKKETSEKELMEWFNKKTGQNVFIYFQTYIPSLNKKNHWVFEVWPKGANEASIERFLSSKEKAKRAAMRYMRNN